VGADQACDRGATGAMERQAELETSRASEQQTPSYHLFPTFDPGGGVFGYSTTVLPPEIIPGDWSPLVRTAPVGGIPDGGLDGGATGCATEEPP